MRSGCFTHGCRNCWPAALGGSHNGNHDRVAPAIRRQDDAVVSILDAGCDIVYVEGAESAADLEKVARAEFLAVR